MLCIIDHTTDPYFNLAAEEYLLKNFKEGIFRLWRNKPSIIVGCNQNSQAEINRDYVHTHNIPVVRRLSGGGAVFHDLGNVNYTFIDKQVIGETTADMFSKYTKPIILALNKLGVNSYLEGRNDLLIDGKKFSGNAICVHKGRVLQHGTLLFSASIEDLSAALNTRPEKFQGKSVKSNISRVTNISSHLPSDSNITPESFIDFLYQTITSNKTSTEEYKVYTYSPEDIKAIEKLRDKKYNTDKWNFGHSPKYSFTNKAKFECGFFEIFMNIDSGIIKECRIMGDFFSIKPVSDIEQALIGVAHTIESLQQTLSQFNIKEYFGNISTEELISIL